MPAKLMELDWIGQTMHHNSPDYFDYNGSVDGHDDNANIYAT